MRKWYEITYEDEKYLGGLGKIQRGISGANEDRAHEVDVVRQGNVEIHSPKDSNNMTLKVYSGGVLTVATVQEITFPKEEFWNVIKTMLWFDLERQYNEEKLK